MLFLLHQEIDESHSCSTFKYIKNKAVKDLKGDQFLRMCKAEEDGLLTVSVGIDLDKSAGYNNIVRQKSLILSTRVVTKISSCRVNTTSRRGIKQLWISFGYIFLLLSYASSRGKSPAPAS